jgi:hypothetical protein
MNRRVRELILISLLAAFCGGLAFAHDATPSVAGQPEIDNRADGFGAEFGRPADGPLTGLDPGPTAPTSIDNPQRNGDLALAASKALGASGRYRPSARRSTRATADGERQWCSASQTEGYS